MALGESIAVLSGTSKKIICLLVQPKLENCMFWTTCCWLATTYMPNIKSSICFIWVYTVPPIHPQQPIIPFCFHKVNSQHQWATTVTVPCCSTPTLLKQFRGAIWFRNQVLTYLHSLWTLSQFSVIIQFNLRYCWDQQCLILAIVCWWTNITRLEYHLSLFESILTSLFLQAMAFSIPSWKMYRVLLRVCRG